MESKTINTLNNQQLIALHEQYPEDPNYSEHIELRIKNALEQTTAKPIVCYIYFALFVILFWANFVTRQDFFQQYIDKNSVLGHVLFFGLMLGSVWCGMWGVMEMSLIERKKFWQNYVNNKSKVKQG